MIDERQCRVRVFVHRKRLLLGVAGVGLFAAGFITAVAIWLNAGDGAWRSTVAVLEARVDADANRLSLSVASCNGAPKAGVTYGEPHPEVEVIAFSTFMHGDDCLDRVALSVPVSMGGPIPSHILDRHSGRVLEVLDRGGSG